VTNSVAMPDSQKTPEFAPAGAASPMAGAASPKSGAASPMAGDHDNEKHTRGAPLAAAMKLAKLRRAKELKRRGV
jgi:hypothetical protein